MVRKAGLQAQQQSLEPSKELRVSVQDCTPRTRAPPEGVSARALPHAAHTGAPRWRSRARPLATRRALARPEGALVRACVHAA
eukprot:2149851-Pyramimonas_sp.AAC.1